MGFLSDIFGGKPKIPTLKSLTDAQGESVASNIASFADIAKLATQTNTFNQDELEALMDRALPGVREQIQTNIGSMARGEVPRDVSAAVTRYGAQRGLGALTTGSQFSNNLTARDLGLTSLNLIDKGLSSAESWLQKAQAPQMDVTSMFITPQQQYAANVDQFNRNFTAAKIKAAPDPATRGLFDTGMSALGMVLSAYGGGPGYQGTYRPDYGGGLGGDGGNSSTWSIGGGGFGIGRQSGPSGAKWFLGSGPGPG